MASASGKGNNSGSGIESNIPDGWTFIRKITPKGRVLEYYGNDLRQRFYTMQDLQRYVEYAKRDGLSIYSPDYQAPKSGKSTSRVMESSSRASCVVKEDDHSEPMATEQKKEASTSRKQKSRALRCASNCETVSTASRASRRLAGLQPEYLPETDTNVSAARESASRNQPR